MMRRLGCNLWAIVGGAIGSAAGRLVPRRGRVAVVWAAASGISSGIASWLLSSSQLSAEASGAANARAPPAACTNV